MLQESLSRHEIVALQCKITATFMLTGLMLYIAHWLFGQTEASYTTSVANFSMPILKSSGSIFESAFEAIAIGTVYALSSVHFYTCLVSMLLGREVSMSLLLFSGLCKLIALFGVIIFVWRADLFECLWCISGMLSFIPTAIILARSADCSISDETEAQTR